MNPNGATETLTTAASEAGAPGSRPGAFVDGGWRDAPGNDSFAVTEPATAAELARIQASGTDEVEAAVAGAKQRFAEDWRWRSPRERGTLMRQVAAHIRAHADELAELEAREVGKPRRDAARFDISYTHAAWDYFGGLADTLHGELLDQGPIEARIVLEPYGVVAAILPFNWPPIHFSKKCAPAVAAGNTVVIKPGEQAPLTVLRLVELVNEVLPPGVINAVSGVEAGAALAGHRDVTRITFTGATATGRKVLQTAAENLTFATMELGGKNALLVLEDADLDNAIDVALEGMYYNQGEACTSTARILVHDSIHDEFLERFARATGDLVVGDPLDAATDIGPMVDKRQQERVLEYLEIGRSEGARLVTQGELPGDVRLRDGYWVAPTVFAGVTPQMRVAQEEMFGPIACVMRFADEADAVRIANDTDYGLTAAICTRDEARAWKLAQQLEAGMIFVNNYMRRAFLGSPFGGVKGSGYGRENAIETLREFVRSKNVRFPSGRGEIPTWPPRD